MTRYLVVNNKEEVEYTIIESEAADGRPEYSLFRGQSADWADDSKGTLVTSVKDTGNGLKFDHSFGKNIGYDEFTELLIILRFLKAKDDLKHIDEHEQYKILKAEAFTSV